MRPRQAGNKLFRWLPATAVLAMLLAGGCTLAPTPTLTRFEFQQPHMGTLFTITLYAENEVEARQATDAAFAKVAALNAIMTDYDSESELMQLCKRPVGQPVRVSPDLFTVLQKSQRLAEQSDGAFDVTIGPIVRQWRRARRTGELPTPGQLERARAAVGWRKLKLDERSQTATLLAPDMQLDLGGIAKGYAADAALVVLHAHGISRALVAASGDIAVGAAPPSSPGWRVSIGTTVPGARPAHTLVLQQAAVSTSGDAEQFVEIAGVRYSHIVDPWSGIGLTNRLQATVIGRHATETDAFATTVCVLGIERGRKLVKSQPGMKIIFLNAASR